MKQPDFEGARQYALARLEHELPAYLTYHSVRHTRDEVAPAAEMLASTQGLNDDSRLLLSTAAWFHDLGFVEQRTDHEAAGVRIAGLVLPGFGYTLADIAAIGGMIMATKLPQSPRTPLECLLADADLDGLGRTDFGLRNVDLRTELAAQGIAVSDYEWYSDQLAFLHGHRYWSAESRALRDPQKQRNLDALLLLLKSCTAPHK